MHLPFTPVQFLELFSAYNRAVFPLQILFNVLAVVAMALCFRQKRHAARWTNAILAFFWGWMGGVYHWGFFTRINNAAYVFGAGFILQALLFAYYGVFAGRLGYKPSTGGRGIWGGILMVFALVLYPLLGIWFGHVYPQSPTFGLPCPTTIFTMGILLWSREKIPAPVLVLPMLWSVIGFTAALQLGITEDISLLVAAAITLFLGFRHRRLFSRQVSASGN